MIGSTDKELKLELKRLEIAKEIKAIKESTIPEEEKSVEIERLKTKQALEEFNIEAQDKFSKVKEMSDSIFNNMNAALDNFVKTGKLNFKDFARSVIQDLIAIQLKAQATSLMGSAMKAMGFGGGSGVGGSAFMNDAGYVEAAGSLGFADGGDPPLNQASMVGERGPELFIPKSAAEVKCIILSHFKLFTKLNNSIF